MFKNLYKAALVAVMTLFAVVANAREKPTTNAAATKAAATFFVANALLIVLF